MSIIITYHIYTLDEFQRQKTMTIPAIYIDGQEGTTGLRIRSLLETRHDLELRLIPERDRKNQRARAELLNAVDLAVLCLPDDGAAEAVELVENPHTRIIDTSAPRRTDPDWVYGLPELCPGQRQAIRDSTRVTNGGCYAMGFVLAVRPLIESGLLGADTPLTVNAVSGYSGGGRRMIESYQQAPPAAVAGDAPIALSLYSLGAAHKHLPEMQRFSLSARPPLFVPSVDHHYCGMLVSIPIPAGAFASDDVGPDQVWEVWNERYGAEPFVRVMRPDETPNALRAGGFLDLGGGLTNGAELFVFGNPELGHVIVCRQDNLGKGASGNAVQCLNLMLGFDETTGLADSDVA